MEVGAVKQAFNNEVILLKKKLNQAKIQVIHKLTRKAKQLAEKKAPETLKEKLKRKAESAVNEVLIIKKIKPRDIAKFIVTHQGELKVFLNKPTVDNDKGCARLLLHKALQDKYKFIRSRFANVPIQDLFMSRLERRKMKKEEKDKKKNKKKNKGNTAVYSEGEWNVEDVEVSDKAELNSEIDDNEQSDEDNEFDKDESQSDDDDKQPKKSKVKESELDNKETMEDDEDLSGNDDANSLNNDTASNDLKYKPRELNTALKHTNNATYFTEKSNKKVVNVKTKEIIKKKAEKKLKDVNKNKNFNDKIQQKKIKKDEHVPIADSKIVDPFFITSTGENYMSVFEPRGPDEVKVEHKQGNRKLRRAVMFGHVPKTKLRQENNYRDNNRFNSRNNYEKGNSFRNKSNNNQEFSGRKFVNNKSDDRNRFKEDNDMKPEKLHPSWEAKKKKSGILPFEGKKIVFD